MGDKLLLNFRSKFQSLFIISHVKLQNCHGNVLCQDGAPGSKMLWMCLRALKVLPLYIFA